jgi:hypothetical protein
VEEWEDVDEYALSVLNNSEDELHKPAAIPTKNPSVTAEDDTKPAATPKKETYKDDQKLAAIPTKNPSVTAENDKKPAATPIIQPAIPSLLTFGSNVVAWICEFCDSQWPPLQKRCSTCKRWKGGKRSSSGKKTQRKKKCVKREAKEKG